MAESTEFVRVLKRGDVLALAFGAMIGFGWIVLTGDFLSKAGALGAALAFVIGGVVIAFIGLLYAELAAAMPQAGGEYVYALRALGSRSAFVTSWALILAYVTVVAFESVSLPQTFVYLFPDMLAGKLWTIAGSDVYATWVTVGIVSAVIMTGLNFVGVRPSAIFQTIAVLFLVAVGLAMVLGSFVGGGISKMDPLFAGGGVVTVLVATPFLFVGFDVIPQSAEEINLPYRQVGRLLVASVGLAVLWYVVIMLTVGSAAPADVLAKSPLAAGKGMTTLWNSDVMGTILVIGGIAGILTSWNAFLLGSSRLLYALGRSGVLPRWFGALHPRFRTPGNAVLFIGGLSVIAPFFGENMLNWLVDAGGLALIVGYLMVAFCFIRLRRIEPAMERPFRVRGGTVVGPIAVLLVIGLGVLYLPGMPSGLSIPEWIIILAWWVVGVIYLVRVPRVPAGPNALHRLQDLTGRR